MGFGTVGPTRQLSGNVTALAYARELVESSRMRLTKPTIAAFSTTSLLAIPREQLHQMHCHHSGVFQSPRWLQDRWCKPRHSDDRDAQSDLQEIHFEPSIPSRASCLVARVIDRSDDRFFRENVHRSTPDQPFLQVVCVLTRMLGITTVAQRDQLRASRLLCELDVMALRS